MHVFEITWQLFDTICRDLATHVVLMDGKPENIYAVPRGGLVVGVRLSHLLDVPMVYDRKQIGPRTLVVDDISDSGTTLTDLFAFLPPRERPKVLCLEMREGSGFEPNYYYRKSNAGEWTLFPWEVSDRKDTVSKVRQP